MSRFAFVVLFWACLAPMVFGHSSSRSFSNWQESGNQVQLRFSVNRLQTSLLAPLDNQTSDLATILAGHLAASIKVRQNQQPCTASLPLISPSAPQNIVVQIVFTCEKDVQTTGWQANNSAFFDLASTHIHIARIFNDPQGKEFVFTDGFRNHQMRAPENAANTAGKQAGFWQNFLTYIRLGVVHILNGFDHLAFVTGLVLLARSTRRVALLATGFTVGHSLTLGLAAYGIIQPNEVAIEALIGFSILYVALEIVIPTDSRDWNKLTLLLALALAGAAIAAWFGFGQMSFWIWVGLAVFSYCNGKLAVGRRNGLRAILVLTTAFGLIHGAGFASVLQEASFSTSRSLPALAGFNIGVEIGQLLVIAVLLALFGGIGRFAGPAKLAGGQTLAGAGILALGVFWFVGRAF
ncbi:hypothetical protein MNBD_ALPHA06-2138 [hydrothermal vent metagenome]|uniref:HupE/UreJ family protein n=1 Tax=hydrothermal vent metagenome TaxID=652676 RepID=A0A3B0RUT6_9ZZZZ